MELSRGGGSGAPGCARDKVEPSVKSLNIGIHLVVRGVRWPWMNWCSGTNRLCGIVTSSKRVAISSTVSGYIFSWCFRNAARSFHNWFAIGQMPRLSNRDMCRSKFTVNFKLTIRAGDELEEWCQQNDMRTSSMGTGSSEVSGAHQMVSWCSCVDWKAGVIYHIDKLLTLWVIGHMDQALRSLTTSAGTR